MQNVYCKLENDKVISASKWPMDGFIAMTDDDPRYIAFINPEEDFEGARSLQHEIINAAFEDAMTVVRGGYPESEIFTWDHQEKEAKAWQANNAADTPMITAIAARRGKTREDVANLVLTKSSAYELAAGDMVGKRQALRDQIDALVEGVNTIEQIKAITWDSI